MALIQSIFVLGSIGFLAGIILVMAYNKLKVEEDPRIAGLQETLPGINCGSCGYASCHEYAVEMVKNKAGINLCTPGGQETVKNIASMLGLDHTDDEIISKKAVVRCGVKKRRILAKYAGPQTCQEAQLLGAGMACRFGCTGFEDCFEVCPFDAIRMNENSVPVIDLQNCTACGLCVAACPRDIIILDKFINRKMVFVGCNNTQLLKETKNVCDVGCIACKICEKKGPEGAFKVENNLSRVTDNNCDIVIDNIKCPTNCIYE